jgi:hypothetical protein
MKRVHPIEWCTPVSVVYICDGLRISDGSGTEGIVGEKGNVVAAAQATTQDTLGRVTTTVTGVAVETAAMAGDALRDKAIEHSVDHAIAEIRDRAHDRREHEQEQTDPDASPESPAP